MRNPAKKMSDQPGFARPLMPLKQKQNAILSEKGSNKLNAIFDKKNKSFLHPLLIRNYS